MERQRDGHGWWGGGDAAGAACLQPRARRSTPAGWSWTGPPSSSGITKRLHNLLHGSPVTAAARRRRSETTTSAVLAGNLDDLRSRVRAGDIVLLHDPQTAGMAEGLRRRGRSRGVALSRRPGHSERADRRGVELPRALRRARRTPRSSRARSMPPMVGPATLADHPSVAGPVQHQERRACRPADVDATLRHAGLVARPEEQGSLAFVRRDGSTGTVRAPRAT